MNLRILHFSDVHLPVPPGAFRTPEILHPKRILASLNFYLRRGAKHADALQKLDGLLDFIIREPVDYILYTGDTLNFGLEREFSFAAPHIAKTLNHARCAALAVPGNHDLYTGTSLAFYRKHFAPHIRSDLPEKATPTGFPLVRWMGEDAVAIAFNTARPNFAAWNSSGRTPAIEIDALAHLLNRPEISSRRHIFLMTHYPFDDHGYFHGLHNSSALLKLLTGRDNLILLHGHDHHSKAERILGNRIPIYCAGSLSKSGDESFWVFEISEDAFRARRGAWCNDQFTLIN